MNPVVSTTTGAVPAPPASSRLDYLDATRAFALLLGILFHASLSFMPTFIGWAVQDVSTGAAVGWFITISHSFRMETFFLLAGLLGHAAFHRKGAGEFVRSRLLRIVVPFVVGWFLLRPLTVSGWIMGSASLRGDYSFWDGLRDGFQSLRSLPAGLFTGSHLWFLYYLALITGLALALRGLVRSAGAGQVALMRWADALVAWLANSPFSVAMLAGPTAVALWFMRTWGMDTPDQSLRPQLPVLAVYGGFFVLGWLVDRQRGLIARFTRLTPGRGLLAVGSAAALLYLGRFQLDLNHPNYVAAHVAYVVSYALTMWSLVFLVIGLFRRFCERPRPWVRYLADSSYWLYLVHLPLVVWLQVAVAEVPLHWSLKLGFIATATTGLGLLSYDLFVRPTFIGWVLNGRRQERRLPGLVFRGLRRLRRDRSIVAPAKLGRTEPAGP